MRDRYISRPVTYLAILALAGCQAKPQPLAPLGPESLTNTQAAPRENSALGTSNGTGRPVVALSRSATVGAGASANASTLDSNVADVTFNFADADIREVTRTILGSILGVDYTIDPAVHGTTTVATPKPVTRRQALAILQNVLGQNGATVINGSSGIYQVVPLAAASSAGNAGNAGADVVPLHYASAPDLVKVLEPFVSQGGRIAASSAQNAILVTGDPLARTSLVSLIKSFDVDMLAHQSYAVFPVTTGTPEKAATALSDALQAGKNGALASQVKVVAMPRADAVLVVASQPAYIEDARRLFAVISTSESQTQRGWHVYYVQNGESGDLELLLQRAFTPDHITSTGASGTKRLQASSSGFSQSGIGSSPLPGSNVGGSGVGSSGVGSSGVGTGATTGGISQGNASQLINQLNGGQADQGGQGAPPAFQPLSSSADNSGQSEQDRMRIIADRKNNALLVYGTPAEYQVVQNMLEKIDIVPLQVEIDATIAEVTLNNTLQYGTQFFFKNGGLSGNLSQAVGSGAFTPDFPGFVLARSSQFAINALQDVTTVKVLSSPQVTVLDNEQAVMQVGDAVPYISQTSQSIDQSNAPVINSVNYQQTGVILQVVPRVNTGGLVSLDIDQEVSDPGTTTSSAINSPTFSNRSVRSRVVVQDGQTVGIAGLIMDSDSKENAGIPIIKDIPVLGSFFSSQNNKR
ncbi:MAG TPA: type II secretion system secretin GspD, partial [Stellaceae bacterium]|nr:type II secretion system secretin GspD [Stellaceae bacterium]